MTDVDWNVTGCSMPVHSFSMCLRTRMKECMCLIFQPFHKSLGIVWKGCVNPARTCGQVLFHTCHKKSRCQGLPTM